MADIRLKVGNAWLGVSGFGVELDIFVATPGYPKTPLTSTPANDAINGTFGNGVYAAEGSYKYITTTGIGTYKIWAELPDDDSIQSNILEYEFDPDHYSGPGDPFDWNGDGIVADLIFPAKWFTIQGVHRRTIYQSHAETTDYDHIVVSPSSTCDLTKANHQHTVVVPASPQTEGQSNFSNLKFAFPGSPGNTFYVYIRDHSCDLHSDAFEIDDVVGSGGTYGVGTLTLPWG